MRQLESGGCYVVDLFYFDNFDCKFYISLEIIIGQLI